MPTIAMRLTSVDGGIALSIELFEKNPKYAYLLGC